MEEDFCGTESQAHGFFWEQAIRKDVFHINPKNKYTCINDIDKSENPFDENENISIKTMGADTLFLGSASRIFSYPENEKHTAIILVYKQRGDTKHITRVVEFPLDDKRMLFGDVTLQEVQDLERKLKTLPKQGVVPKELRVDIEDNKNELNRRTDKGVQFNIKIDTKSQRRLQCSIPKFDDFLTRHADVLLYDSPHAVVREIPIPDTFVSKRRVRNAGTKKRSSLRLRKTTRSRRV